MTCRNLQRVRVCKDALPGKPVTAYVFAQGAACFLLPLRGCGLPRRSAPRNDMLKEDARQRLQGGTAGVLPESVLATADMPPSSAHPSRQTPLQPLTPARLQHVIANQCAHWCGNPHPRSETCGVFVQYRGTAGIPPETSLHPRTPARPLHVIARSGAAAPRRGNPFSCGSTKQRAVLKANTEKCIRICPK